MMVELQMPQLWGPATWGSAVWQLVALWLVGALCGWLLPRPSKANGGGGTGAAWASLSSLVNSTAWRRAALAWHGAIIMREVWYHFTCPGTFRRLFSACVGLARGQGWHFDFPTASQPGLASGTPCDRQLLGTQLNSLQDSWYVTSKDLEFFQESAEPEPGACKPPHGCGPWELMMEREIPCLVKYTAWRRTLANGKTEYRSVTISPDATAHEFMDMYFDDDNRPNWDTMIIAHESLEHGVFAQRQQVVRWVRRFPFSFISDREYVIAKRMFAQGPYLYGITKAVDHPRAAADSSVVRADVFYSMWRSHTVDCPWGTGKPACQTLLLHHEQMKIPENLARFAVRHGMWGFVRKLSTETPKFVEARRARCSPHTPDPAAYGAGFTPNPPAPAGASIQATGSKGGMMRTETAMSTLSALSSPSSASADVGPEGGDGNGLLMRSSTSGLLQGGRTRSGKLRGLAAFAIASSIALLVKRSSSSDRLPPLSARRTGSTTSLRALRRARTAACLTDALEPPSRARRRELTDGSGP